MTFEAENGDEKLYVFPIPYISDNTIEKNTKIFDQVCKKEKRNGLVIGHYLSSERKRVLIKTIKLSKTLNSITRYDVKLKELGITDRVILFCKIITGNSNKDKLCPSILYNGKYKREGGLENEELTKRKIKKVPYEKCQIASNVYKR